MEKLIAICNENHVVQCFILLKNPDIGRKIVLRMKTSFSALAMNQYGGVVQRAILSVSDELRRIMTEAIVLKTYMLSVDDFGHHML